VTGDDLINEGAQLRLACQPTPGRWTCADPSCVYSLGTWDADLPAFVQHGSERAQKRAWPKCPNTHRARFLFALSGGGDFLTPANDTRHRSSRRP